MYNIIYETSHQSRFDARYWMLGAGALGRPRGMEWGRRREEGSGWRTRVYLWRIHVDIWQNQYYIVKLKNTIKKKKNFQQNGEGQGRLRGHPARCDAAPSLRTVLPLSLTTEILCNLNRLSWQHRCPRTLPVMPGKVILQLGDGFQTGSWSSSLY